MPPYDKLTDVQRASLDVFTERLTKILATKRLVDINFKEMTALLANCGIDPTDFPNFRYWMYHITEQAMRTIESGGRMR